MTSTIGWTASARAATRARMPAWVVGAAGLGYVVAAGVENMEALRRPVPGAGAEAIRAAYADQALAAVTSLAGVASLLLYVVFATSLAARVRLRAPALAAAVVGPGFALAGLAASAPLVTGAGLSDDGVRDAFALQQDLRLVAGPAMATVLVCLGRGGALPRALSRAAVVIAVPLALTPAAALTEAKGVHIAAGAAFGLHLLWIWLASLWLAVGAVDPAELVRRAAFMMLVVAAGLVGVALLLLPDRTGAFFAWELRPASLAGFAGGVYVGSAVVYGAALRAPWWRARSLVAAAVVLSLSVLVVTLVHREPFDFGRLQAWAWLGLFAAFAAVTTALLLKGGPRAPGPGVPLPSRVRGLLGTVAVALAELAVILWIDPAALPPLGGRFAGSWAAMLAVLAGWAAAVDRRDEARLPGLALVALPAGALLGAVRTGHPEPLQVAGLLALMASGAAVLRLNPR